MNHCKYCGGLGCDICNYGQGFAPVSAPTEGERQSIGDDPEFERLRAAYCNALYGNLRTYAAAKAALIAHIDTWAARSAAEAVPELVGFARDTELAKLADGRTAGVGMMIHKESREGMTALYRAAAAAPDATLLSAVPTEAETVVVDVDQPPAQTVIHQNDTKNLARKATSNQH